MLCTPLHSPKHNPCNIQIHELPVLAPGTPEAVDLQTAAAAVQRRDAAVLVAVREAASGCSDAELVCLNSLCSPSLASDLFNHIPLLPISPLMMVFIQLLCFFQLQAARIGALQLAQSQGEAALAAALGKADAAACSNAALQHQLEVRC